MYICSLFTLSFCVHVLIFSLSSTIFSPRFSHEQNSSQYVGVHRLFASRRSHFSTINSQAQGRGAKENGAENVGDAETTRQFEYPLLQRRHRSWGTSRRTLTTGRFQEINLSDGLEHLHTFYLLCLLFSINFA
jgi:hypothetical protein